MRLCREAVRVDSAAFFLQVSYVSQASFFFFSLSVYLTCIVYTAVRTFHVCKFVQDERLGARTSR